MRNVAWVDVTDELRKVYHESLAAVFSDPARFERQCCARSFFGRHTCNLLRFGWPAALFLRALDSRLTAQKQTLSRSLRILPKQCSTLSIIMICAVQMSSMPAICEKKGRGCLPEWGLPTYSGTVFNYSVEVSRTKFQAAKRPKAAITEEGK